MPNSKTWCKILHVKFDRGKALIWIQSIYDKEAVGCTTLVYVVHSANTNTKKQESIILMYKEWALNDWNNSEKLLWIEFSHEQTLEINNDA